MPRRLHNHKEYKIASVQQGSIAWEMEIEPGDTLLSISGKEIEDIFDYRYLTNEEYLVLLIRKANGEEWELEIEKEYEEDLGIEFENALMDEYRSCSNKCVFCFIDQMPEGMRPTLYFKDDDSRLSFLQGNYVTLTNMSDHDIDRIIYYHLEPINVSFHALNPELRAQMLNNRFAGKALEKAKRLAEAGITLNGQIVLCKGINDGEELEYSLKALEEYMPALQSLSIVPVGLTRYREGLRELEPFTREDAAKVLEQIHRWQHYYENKYDNHLIHPGDEWYILAEQPIPEASYYDGYTQLENGVGMVRLLLDECHEEIEKLEGDNEQREVSIATGKLAAPFLEQIMTELKGKYPNLTVHIYPIRNDFFGERITVAGLVTGQDLMKQLRDQPLGERLLLPINMLRSGERVFLDDVTVEQLQSTLQTKTVIVESAGYHLIQSVLNGGKE